MLSSRSPVSLSSSSATLLLFLFVSLPLPLPLLATPAPDQYDAATAHHHGYQPKIRSIKFQSSETVHPLKESRDGQPHTVKLQQQSGNVPSEALHHQHTDGQLHSIKLQHTGFGPSDSLLPLQTPQGNDKLSSDHNKKTARNARSVDASQIHRVKLAKSDYQTGSLLPLQVSQLTRKESDQKKYDVPVKSEKETIHYEGDDDITIDDVKSLDESLLENEDYNSPLEELDINVEDNNIPLIYSNIPRSKRETDQETKVETKEDDSSVRQKRDFIHWYGTSSFQHYQPQQTYISSYQLSGRIPYYIPIWGSPSRIPVYFPLKPILFNPGYPVANPPQQPPTQTEKPNTDEGNIIPPTDGKVDIGNRNNFEVNQSWGVVEQDQGKVNGGGGVGGGGGGESAQRPTQERKPPTPSLLHRPSRTDQDDELEANPPLAQVPNELNPSRPNGPQGQGSSRPPQIPNNNRDPLFDLGSTQGSSFVQQQITTQRPPVSNFPPGNNQVLNEGRAGPSRCVWAVVSCCSPLSTNVRYACFEQLGCPGPFWDGNPCSRDYTAAALMAAQKFYEQSGSRR